MKEMIVNSKYLFLAEDDTSMDLLLEKFKSTIICMYIDGRVPYIHANLGFVFQSDIRNTLKISIEIEKSENGKFRIINRYNILGYKKKIRCIYEMDSIENPYMNELIESDYIKKHGDFYGDIDDDSSKSKYKKFRKYYDSVSTSDVIADGRYTIYRPSGEIEAVFTVKDNKFHGIVEFYVYTGTSNIICEDLFIGKKFKRKLNTKIFKDEQLIGIVKFAMSKNIPVSIDEYYEFISEEVMVDLID